MVKSKASKAMTLPGRPGRRPSLNAEQRAMLRAIPREQPQPRRDEVPRAVLGRAARAVPYA